jgi:23S rRNA (guanosine2251-2'-O)-methyltransferase
MSEAYSMIRQCLRPTCRFRYPVTGENAEITACPKCGSPTRLVESPYPGLKVDPRPVQAGRVIQALLDNIRSSLNVGSMFRTADGAGVSHLHLCGITPAPDHPKVAKTALGAEFSVPWTQYWDALEAADSLKQGGFELWALEGGPRSISIFEAARDQPPSPSEKPLLLVVGNEVSGVDPGLLELCQQVVNIPMQGAKQSLNVAVAFGIAVYTLRYRAGL